MMECIAHLGMAGVTLGNEVFTDLDFADDVTLLVEMLVVLVLAMTKCRKRRWSLVFR